MKKLFVLLLVVAISAGAFLTGVVVGPKLGSTTITYGEVVLGEMKPVTNTDGVPFIITTRN